jgi:hypothetical protein
MNEIKTIEQLEKIVGKGKGLLFLANVEAKAMAWNTERDMVDLLLDGILPISERWEATLHEMAEPQTGWPNDLEGWPTEEDVRDEMKALGWDSED